MRGTHPTPCQKGTTLTFTSMIVHNYYHLWKGTSHTSTSMIGHNYYHLWKGTALTSNLDSSERHNTYIHQHDRTQLLSSVKSHDTHIHKPSRTHLLPSVERHCTYIWPWLIRKALNPRLKVPGNWPGASIQRMATTFISDQVGTHPSITSEWPCAHIWSYKTTSHNHIRMALSPRLIIPSNWPGASILLENGNSTPSWVFSVTDQVPPFQ